MNTAYRPATVASDLNEGTLYYSTSEENIDPSGYAYSTAEVKQSKVLPHLKGQRQYQSGVLESSPIRVNENLPTLEEQKMSSDIVGSQNVSEVRSKSGLDIDSVPRPTLIPEENTVKGIRHGTKIEPGFPSPPPSAVTRHYSIDEGNSIPRMLRCSLQHLPTDGDSLFNKAMFPFGVIVQPFAELSEFDTPIPLSNYGNEKLLRCARCGAYVNPKFNFVSGGSQIMCNICGVTSPAPTQEITIVQQSNRVELTKGTYDLIAPEILNGKKIKGNNFVFLIECTQNAIKFGIIIYYCRVNTASYSFNKGYLRLYA